MTTLYLIHKASRVGFIGKEGDVIIPTESFVGYLKDGTEVIVNFKVKSNHNWDRFTAQNIVDGEVVNHSLDVRINGIFVKRSVIDKSTGVRKSEFVDYSKFTDDELGELFGVKYE